MLNEVFALPTPPAAVELRVEADPPAENQPEVDIAQTEAAEPEQPDHYPPPVRRNPESEPTE